MFTVTNAFGDCPYDGFWLHSDQTPRTEWAILNASRHRRRPRGTLWGQFVSKAIAGCPGALKVAWEPLVSFPGMPKARIYFNPSTTGYSPEMVVELLSDILPDPLTAHLVQLDTKVDVQGVYWQVAAHIYLPYVRYTKNLEFDGTVYEGKRTKMTAYQKSGRSGNAIRDKLIEVGEPAITRVELRQKFSRPNRVKLEAFLRGDLMDSNLMRRLSLIEDLDELGDRVLAEEALKRGLTRALRDYPKFCNVTQDEVLSLKRRIKRIASPYFFDLYQAQALAWHGSFGT